MAKGTWKVTPDVEKYTDAVDWFLKRTVITGGEAQKLNERLLTDAFWIGNGLQLAQVQRVFDAIGKAVEKGTPLDEFKQSMRDVLRNPAHAETVFRNATQRAYNAARWFQMQEPSVRKFRPYGLYDAILDGRTTPICTVCNKTILPLDHAWWLTHWPPMHHNAIDADSMVTTERGQRRAGDVTVGTLVLTHTGRWRRATAVLRKRVRERPVRVLTTASGRTLRVTYEHPILRAGSLSWEPAGNLQVGDTVFQHGQQPAGIARACVGNPKDAPPLLHEPSVARGIMSSTHAAAMVLPVDLDANSLVRERDVDDVTADAMLCDGPGGTQEVEQILFRRCEFLAEGDGARPSTSCQHVLDTGWIRGSHASAMLGDARVGIGAETPRPVVFTGASGDHVGVSVADFQLGVSAAQRDSVDLAPAPDDAVAGVEFALEGTHAATLLPVLDVDERFESSLVSEVEWHTETIVSIVEARYSGELVDLTVEDDESYVASGIVVHNCRSSVRNLRKAEAERRGITEKIPETDAGKSWGLAPTKAKPPKPDAKKVDPALRKALDKKAANTNATKKRQPKTPKPKLDVAKYIDEYKRCGDAAASVAHGRAAMELGLDLPVSTVRKALSVLDTEAAKMMVRALPSDGKLTLRDHGAEIDPLLKAAAALAGHLHSMPKRAAVSNGDLSWRQDGKVALDFFSKASGAGVKHPEDWAVKVDQGRGSSNSAKKLIKFPSGNVGTLAHEWAHGLEALNPALLKRAVAFLEARTKDEQAQSLTVLTGLKHDDSEKAQKDGFIEPYIGKEYRGADGKRYATEVTSMGVELLVGGKRFWGTLNTAMQEDPEFVFFTLGQLKGE